MTPHINYPIAHFSLLREYHVDDLFVQNVVRIIVTKHGSAIGTEDGHVEIMEAAYNTTAGSTPTSNNRLTACSEDGYKDMLSYILNKYLNNEFILFSTSVPPAPLVQIDLHKPTIRNIEL